VSHVSPDDEFEARYDAMMRVAYRAAYRLLGQRAAAEDVAAEALARAYSRWRSVQEHAEPWVVTVATRLALDVVRAGKRASSARHVLVEQDAVRDPNLDLRLDLQRALAALPRRQREVVALRFLGDFSEQQTAAALGLDVGTVKSHSSRGLAKLRLALEGV
jgi:RNA polymerase sigma factor (sigma-70 family)